MKFIVSVGAFYCTLMGFSVFFSLFFKNRNTFWKNHHVLHSIWHFFPERSILQEIMQAYFFLQSSVFSFLIVTNSKEEGNETSKSLTFDYFSLFPHTVKAVSYLAEWIHISMLSPLYFIPCVIWPCQCNRRSIQMNLWPLCLMVSWQLKTQYCNHATVHHFFSCNLTSSSEIILKLLYNHVWLYMEHLFNFYLICSFDLHVDQSWIRQYQRGKRNAVTAEHFQFIKLCKY